jgi:Protein of unknown function (DUF5818)
VKRKTGLCALLVFLAASFPLAFGQDRQIQPAPVLPADILGPQLIAWSQLQKPLPLMLLDRPIQRSDSDQAADQQPPQSVNPPAQPQSPAAQTFTGTIISDGMRYVLKVSSNNVYQLDDQQRAKQYEGKQVKIVGTLDATGNSLHITNIELVS